MKTQVLFLSLLTLVFSLSADSPRCTGPSCAYPVNPGSIEDETNPDTIERVEDDFMNPDDPEDHVPGQVGPFGE